MTPLERLFRHLVQNLAALDPARLRSPVSLADIHRSIIPYRAHRRALGVDTSEDYELLLLRLCAGEGGFARAAPEELRARFEEEAEKANPDLEVLHEHGEAAITLAAERVAHALGSEPGSSFAPRRDAEAEAEPSSHSEANADSDQEGDPTEVLQLDAIRRRSARSAAGDRPGQSAVAATIEGGYRCGYCGADLPSGRAVNFCPHCGQTQSLSHCPGCRQEVELGWRYCVNCGYALGER